MTKSLQAPLPPMAVKRTDADDRRPTALDHPEPRPAQEGYGGQLRSIAMTMIVKDALLRHYGSFKAAAFYMGEMDQGQLCRDLDSGKFKFERLELCDLQAKASVVKALHAHFGNADPKAHLHRLLRDLRRAVEELAEAVA